MRKTLLYFVVLALLGFSVYYFIFSNKNALYGSNEAAFTVRDTASIGKIFIANTDGKSILLERTDSGWMLNKQYKALRSTLNTLLLTLAEQEALYPVNQNAYNNVIKSLSADGIKVILYNRSGKMFRTFYVGGSSVNQVGTNMLMEGADKPYVVQIQGFDGYLTPRYTTDIKAWRDRTVFNIPQEQIKSVSVRYPDHPLNSFVITQDDSNKITVTGNNTIIHYQHLNMRRSNVYLKYFTNLNCEGYMNGIDGIDSVIKNTGKQSIVDITDIHGNDIHADIYWMPINRRSKNLATSDADVPDIYDADRLYAVINNAKDTVMIQQFVFKKLFRKLYEFYEQDEEIPPGDKKYVQPKNVMIHKNI